MEVRLPKGTRLPTHERVNLPSPSCEVDFPGITLLCSAAPSSPCLSFAHREWVLLHDSWGGAVPPPTPPPPGLGNSGACLAQSMAAEDKSPGGKEWPTHQACFQPALYRVISAAQRELRPNSWAESRASEQDGLRDTQETRPRERKALNAGPDCAWGGGV